MKLPMRSIHTAILLLVSLLISSPASAGERKETAAEAAAAAQEFLHLADAGHYGASWDKTAPIFKSRVSRDEWAETLSGVRPPFGAVVSRKVEAAEFSTSLPGVPDGEYAIIRFATSFVKKAEAIETVTMVRAQDEWLVAGYFIK